MIKSGILHNTVILYYDIYNLKSDNICETNDIGKTENEL